MLDVLGLAFQSYSTYSESEMTMNLFKQLYRQLYRYLGQFTSCRLAIETDLRAKTQPPVDGLSASDCSDLASHLEVSDYDIFVRANEWYHGYRTVTVDSDFKNYLLSGCDNVPYYVRQFTRNWQPSYLTA